MLILTFNSTDISAQSQVFISEKWSGTGGLTTMYHHNASKTDDQQNVYVAGSTLNSWGYHDIILQKFDRDGELLWQQTHHGLAELNDMAADLFIDDQHNVYVTGTTTEYAQSGYDLCVLKYNSQGTLQWKYRYDNGAFPLPYDAGTAITGDNDGSIFVTGGSMADTSMSDFITIRLNTSNGNEEWTKRYDYTALSDISAKIAIKDGQLVVAGASQITATPERWELATLTYAVSDGSLINTRRTTGSATDGVDEIYDITVDDDHIYVAGAVNNTTTGFDIRIYKLDDDLNIVWEEDFDGYEGTDKAHGVKVDDNGNVYVAGFVTHPTQGRNYITLKFDSDGDLQWQREYNGQANANDEAVQLVIDEEERIFVTGKLQNNDYTDYVTIGYYSNGDIFGQAIFYSPSGLNDKPSAITIDLDDNLIVTGQCEQPGGSMRTYTVKYKVYDKPIVPVIIDSVPSHNANELLIRFDRSVMNYAAVDNRAFTAGELSDFVKPQAIDSMNAKVPGVDFSKLEAYKVFLGMTTADSLSVTRLGDTVRVRDFWATLAVYMPEEYHLEQTIDSLNTIGAEIRYTHLNPFGKLFNDPYYINGNQPGLNNPNFGVNIEEAWQNQTGSPNTRVGIYDSGINWRHEDFGNGTQDGTKIADGWDFLLGLSPFIQPLADSYGHGTAVASIVGALRNNNKGIAGIAGGDILVDGNSSASLFSWNIGTHLDLDPLNPNHAVILHSIASPAIVFTAISTPNWGNPMNIQNHSWGSEFSTFLLRDAVRTAFENQIVFVAASGNDGENSPKYPASYLDEHVLKIGASNSDPTGSVWSNSNYGYDLDLVAPGTFDTYSACDHDNNNGYSYSESGTSFAAAHVSGCAALLVSEHSLSNINHNYPNNLAPEDVESIFSIYATNLGAPGYDIQSGHGMLNCGNSLQKIALPEYSVKHYVSHSQNYTLVESGILVSIEESVNNVIPGVYYANRYEVTSNETISIEQYEQLEGAWPRYSSSKSYSQDPLIYDRNIYSFNYNTNGQNVNIMCEGYCWELTANIAGETLTNTWAPYHPSELEFAYSLHLKHGNVTSSEQKTDFQFTIFPNPTKSNINLLLDNSLLDANEVKIISLTGKIVLHQLMDDRSHNQPMTIDVSRLSSGLYVIEVSDHTGNSSRKKLLISK